MKDIAPELLERIEKEFKRTFEADSTIRSLYKKIKDGTATYEDAQSFAVKIGELLADTFKRNLSSEILPDGRFYYNIASRILNSTLGKNHDLISDYSAGVQNISNRKAGIRIKAQTADPDQERIDGIVDIVSGKSRFDDIAYMLKEPVINFGQAVVDETLRKNIEFQGKSGKSPKVIRRATGKPCRWCAAIAGTYTYPDVPKDVFRRHQRCRCIVEYDPGTGRRQNVHSKELTDEAELEKRKSVGLETPLKKDAQKLEKKLSGQNQSDIIKPDRVISGHSGTPKEAAAGTVIDHLGKDGRTETRTFYNSMGLKKKDITNHDHKNPKMHPYGKNGEHAHDYIWDNAHRLKEKTTRELTDTERKENDDIL